MATRWGRIGLGLGCLALFSFADSARAESAVDAAFDAAPFDSGPGMDAGGADAGMDGGTAPAANGCNASSSAHVSWVALVALAFAARRR